MHGWKSAALCPLRNDGPLMLAGPGKRQTRGRRSRSDHLTDTDNIDVIGK